MKFVAIFALASSVFSGLDHLPLMAQSFPTTRVYEITSGEFLECCGFAGESRIHLPTSSQRFVRLDVDPQKQATISFLSEDMHTIFTIAACAPSPLIEFSFNNGFFVNNEIIFHVDPGPQGLYWNYTVTNSSTQLQIEGKAGLSQSQCADTYTQFTHTNLTAEFVPPPKMDVREYSKDGALIFIQGHAGWRVITQASTDLLNWTNISTNIMPATLCPICPYVEFRDQDSRAISSRFYRCFQQP